MDGGNFRDRGVLGWWQGQAIRSLKRNDLSLFFLGQLRTETGSGDRSVS